MTSVPTDPAAETAESPFTAAVVAREEAGIRAESFLAFSERLAIEIDVEDCAEVALREMAAYAGATAGAISLADGERLTLVATLGVAPPLLRAVEPLAALSLATEHEVRIRLVHGYEGIGTVLLGRNGEPFSADDLAALERLAEQAAIALGKLLALRQAVGHATLNHAVLDAIDEAVVFTDASGRALVTNAVAQGFAADLGAQADNVWDQLAATALATTDIERFRRFAAALAADPELAASHEFEHAVTGRSFLCRSGPVRDASGELIGRIFATRETTAERAAERLRDELVANVSHELRTPLTSILGYLDLLAEAGLDEEGRGYLAVVERNARRLLRRVDELLFLAHAESGTVALELEDVDLHALAGDAVETALPLAQQRDTTLELAGEGPLVVRGDAARLGQLADNLLGNALKYTPRGGAVHVAVERRGAEAVLEISDTGVGIAPDDQERIFDRFFRGSAGSSARMASGSGLGLAISKAIVDAHGGTIAVASSRSGSTFTIRLPLAG
jgi:signal transduction histidine kinase